MLAAESPHLSGVQSAVRNGLGYALLAAGGDGLRAVARGPLAETIPAPLWLLVDRAHRRLVAPLRAALWRAHDAPRPARGGLAGPQPRGRRPATVPCGGSARRGSRADHGRAPGGNGPPRGCRAASSWDRRTSRMVARW